MCPAVVPLWFDSGLLPPKAEWAVGSHCWHFKAMAIPRAWVLLCGVFQVAEGRGMAPHSCWLWCCMCDGKRRRAA